MPKIHCQATSCLHNHSKMCDVTDDTVIDIDRNGVCVDNSIVTDEEYILITGHERITAP